MLWKAGSGHRLGTCDSQLVPRMKVKATSVARDHALLSGGCSNSACNTDLGADSSKAIGEERCASTCFAIPPESPRPFAFVCQEVSLHKVVWAEGRRYPTRLGLLAAASMRYGDPER